MHTASVSIDGTEETHDLLRACRGSFAAATAALDAFGEAGVHAGVNTNVNRLNRADLETVIAHAQRHGARGWQVQLTAPLGRAADRPELILQPWDLLDLLPRLAALERRAHADGVLLLPGNNLGFFGPEEATLRSLRPDGHDHFRGCQAGRFTLGIESNGDVKGCPSLQSEHYVGGTLRERTLAEPWHSESAIDFARTRTVDDPWGFCRDCDFASECLAGCTFTAHALLGRPGSNPYCHYRARTLARQGLRERLVARESPPGRPFDSGRFELVREALDAPDPVPSRRESLVQIRRG